MMGMTKQKLHAAEQRITVDSLQHLVDLGPIGARVASIVFYDSTSRALIHK